MAAWPRDWYEYFDWEEDAAADDVDDEEQVEEEEVPPLPFLPSQIEPYTCRLAI